MMRKMGDYFFRYRYPLALCLFILGILLEFTGSSIGMWNTYYGTEDTGVLLGSSRDIRMDEWATLTPFVWSQYFGDNPFSYFSSIVRGTSTDVFLEYGTPVMSLAMLFRPFYLGYLFLPIAKGMAFFWCGRIIALFMASFEFGRILTKDKRGIALIYGLFITFAPVVQWWFSTNGFVEMLIAMQLAVVLLWKYMEVDSYKKKIACMIGIGICAGTFTLTMYPSWMVPLAYVLIILIIWTFYEHRDNFRIKSGDVVIVATIIVITGIGVLFILLKSKETIDLLANTAYP
ncbi:MAG: hypothetical protein K5675_01480, partial [Lachnospiraceae bacterium]|nr:hypothetical protein [Lachnospiraceae bacterium]